MAARNRAERDIRTEQANLRALNALGCAVLLGHGLICGCLLVRVASTYCSCTLHISRRDELPITVAHAWPSPIFGSARQTDQATESVRQCHYSFPPYGTYPIVQALLCASHRGAGKTQLTR